jgi:hypothetical protein
MATDSLFILVLCSPFLVLGAIWFAMTIIVAVHLMAKVIWRLVITPIVTAIQSFCLPVKLLR